MIKLQTRAFIPEYLSLLKLNSLNSNLNSEQFK